MTEALSVYRRQPIIREICQALNYQGRFVWLIGANQVPIMASKQIGLSRLKFQILDITGDSPKVTKFTPRDGHKVKLDQKIVLTVLPMLRGRRRDLFVFVNPFYFHYRVWSQAERLKIAPEERAVLQDKDEAFDAGTTAVAHTLCVYRGLIDPRGRPTELGVRLLAAKKK